MFMNIKKNNHLAITIIHTLLTALKVRRRPSEMRETIEKKKHSKKYGFYWLQIDVKSWNVKTLNFFLLEQIIAPCRTIHSH